jgi:hypothetical protein
MTRKAPLMRGFLFGRMGDFAALRPFYRTLTEHLSLAGKDDLRLRVDAFGLGVLLD